MKRKSLADVAEAFAAKHVVGEKTNTDYMEMPSRLPKRWYKLPRSKTG